MHDLVDSQEMMNDMDDQDYDYNEDDYYDDDLLEEGDEDEEDSFDAMLATPSTIMDHDQFYWFDSPMNNDENKFSLKESALYRRIATELKTGRERVMKKRKELEFEFKTPKFIRQKDKYTFTIGVILTVCTTAITARYSYLLPPFYMFWCVILLGARFFIYHRNHYHYFMLDFCYFSNLLLPFYLFMYPTSGQLYMLNFANANGPLLWAIVTWGNSLVFHDLDKITSVFIHAFPPIVTFAIRHFPESHRLIDYETCINNSCTVSFSEMVVPHLVFFAFWQTCYYLKTEVIDRDRMKRNQNLITSFRWMRQYERSPVYKILNKYAERYQLFIFMALQFFYHMVTIIPVKLMYDYPMLHYAAMIYVFVQCVHNGSNFYIEKFSSSYLKRLEEIAISLHQSQLSSNEKPTKLAASTTSSRDQDVGEQKQEKNGSIDDSTSQTKERTDEKPHSFNSPSTN